MGDAYDTDEALASNLDEDPSADSGPALLPYVPLSQPDQGATVTPVDATVAATSGRGRRSNEAVVSQTDETGDGSSEALDGDSSNSEEDELGIDSTPEVSHSKQMISRDGPPSSPVDVAGQGGNAVAVAGKEKSDDSFGAFVEGV